MTCIVLPIANIMLRIPRIFLQNKHLSQLSSSSPFETALPEMNNEQ